MPQDANARLNAKRKATQKIARLKEQAAAAENKAPKKEKKSEE